MKPLLIAFFLGISALKLIAVPEIELVPVRVIDKSTDTTGARLCYQVKESIRRSSNMTLIEKNESSIVINISTIPYSKSENTATIYSIIWTLNVPQFRQPQYLNSTLGYVGSTRIDETAESIIAFTDNILAAWRQRK